MADKKRYETARPSNVGPHHVNRDQADPEAPPPRPEEMYKNEIGGQTAGLGPQGSGKRAQEPVKKG